MVEYKKAVDEADAVGDQKPRVPNYVGHCLVEIATRLATKPNFANYPAKDDMISDGIENCIRYIDNFDPTRFTNPFAYFTQIIYYAFLRRIQKEKKQLYIKHKALENSMIFDSLVEHGSDSEHFSGLQVDLGSDYMKEFVTNFEETTERKRRATKKPAGVEKFFN